MSNLDKMIEEYNQIPIPEELSFRIQAEINKSKKKQEERGKQMKKQNNKKIARGFAAAAAAACILFTTALNTSQVFAQEASKLPVIGGIARVLTFRSYETKQDDIAITVDIPTIEMIAKDTGIEVDAINQEILDLCNEYADEALKIAEEYRTAFLETGGTVEEWAEHDVKISVGYEMKQQSNDYLSFIIRGTQNWANAYNEAHYYNMDLKTGKMVTLQDLLGDDYEKLVNESIKDQIAKRENAGETFFAPDAGGFTGITEDVKFFINENNHPVIVFEKYEIAPGSSGEITFEIGGEESQKEEAANIDEPVKEQEPEFFEDNFSIDNEVVKQYASKIKQVVADKDFEALADMMTFPVYVGLEDVGVVETKEAFLKLDADKIFTDKILETIQNADIEHLNPSMAGFCISDGGRTNINFGVVDGVLKINGMNFE